MITNAPIYTSTQTPLITSSKHKTTLKVFLILIIVVIILSTSLLIWQKFVVKQQTNNVLVAKVGTELIYKQSLNKVSIPNTTDLPNIKPPRDSDQSDALKEMVIQSIILQAAKSEGLITLDPTIFNSENIDYQKRAQAVSAINQKIDEQSNGVRGWIYAFRFNQPPKGSYEQRKNAAYKMATEIHNQLVTGKSSFEQIYSLISESGYSPPSFFRTEPIKPITFYTKLDKSIYSLKEGEVSDILLLNDSDYSGTKDLKNASDSAIRNPHGEVYMFGQVTQINNAGKPNANTWFENKAKEYEIIYY